MTTRPTMEFTAPLAAFRNALERALTVVPQRATLPILKCVLVSADAATETSPDRVAVRATDIDRVIDAAVVPSDTAVAVVAVPGSIALPAAELKAAVQFADAETLTLVVRDQCRAELRIGRARYKLHGLPADQWPEVRDVPAASVDTRVPAGVLQRAVRRVSYATSTEPSRPLAQGVLFEPRNGEIAVVGIDGRRAAEVRLPITAAVGDEAILPRSAAESLASVFDGDELVTVQSCAGMLAVASSQRRFRTRLIEGPFPPWRQNVRGTSTITARFDRVALADAIRRVSFAADSDFRAMGLRLTHESGGTCYLWTSTADRGEATDVIGCTYEGPDDFAIGCGAGFLRDALTRTFIGSVVTLGFESPRHPIECTDPDDPQAFVLIGPINPPVNTTAAADAAGAR